MPKLAANLSTMFVDLPILQRPAAAAKAGFSAVELRFPDPLQIDPLAKAISDCDLQVVLFNASPGNQEAGELGLAALPTETARFKRSIHTALSAAQKLGAKCIHVLAGLRDPNITRSEQLKTAVKNYSWAAQQAQQHGITLVIEPLAPVIAKHYFITSLERAVDLVSTVGSPNFKILFDLFHLQLAGGDIVARFTSVLPVIGHVQIAAAPSRAEPDRGELNIDFILQEIDKTTYSGWVGCEYSPASTTLEGLHWANRWLGAPTPDKPFAQPQSQTGLLPVEGRFLGRVWDPTINGPCVVTVRDGAVLDITSKKAPLVRDICEMDNPAAYVATATGREIGKLDHLLATPAGTTGQPYLLAPCDLQPVKACGVTFAKSMIERVIEEQAAGNPMKAEEIRNRVLSTVGSSLRDVRAGSPEAAELKLALLAEGLWSQYLEVGIGPDAEVFSKAQVLSSVGHGAKVGLHPSSTWNNPEPELVLAVSAQGRIVGASLGNDVNLRDIEGRSALLLSKAKDNNASCAIGPFIRLFDADFTLDHLRRTELGMTIEGPEGYRLEGRSSMAEISRDPEDLVKQVIGRHHQYPDGFMLFLGTGFAPTQDRDVPGEGFTHKRGDRVSIRCAALGQLENTVDLSSNCPEWCFGIRDLISNLARRGLI